MVRLVYKKLELTVTMYYSRGDTLVEVMFSFAVFSLVVVSSLVLMNRGVAMAQHSLEITLVRQQIDGQIALVQHERQLNTAVWNAIKSNPQDTVTEFSSITDCPTTAADFGSGAFFIAKATTSGDELKYYPLDPSAAGNHSPAVTYSMTDVMLKSAPAAHTYGLWAVLVRAENYGANAAYDLHVRACWATIGLNRPAKIGTVVRIYDY